MTHSNLLISVRKASKLAQDTEIISEIKENSVKELNFLNYEMENTLLYCRITPDATLIHIVKVLKTTVTQPLFFR